MHTLVIAEACVNHNGDMNIARDLVDAAANAGADVVKFQTFTAEGLITKNAQKAEYQKKTLPTETQYQMLKRLELSHDNHKSLMSYCKRRNIKFLSTAFDEASLDLLLNLGLDELKIPSGEITNLPFLRKLAEANRSLILSTGMSDILEVENALAVLEGGGMERNKIKVLHCNTEYPTPFKDVNIRAMSLMKLQLDVEVGYSDHTAGIEVPIAAVALGATIIEKHLTLDRGLKGPDHAASLEPTEFTKMVSGIRNIESALGDELKKVSPSETQNRKVIRKSLVALKPIKIGEAFSSANIGAKRPGTGMANKWIKCWADRET